MSLLEATKSLLADPVRMNKLCAPAAVDDQSLVGAHLRKEQVRDLHEELLAVVEKVSLSVERAMTRTDAEIQNPQKIAGANSVLNVAVAAQERKEEVPAGLITNIREIGNEISRKMSQLYGRFSAMGNLTIGSAEGDYSYLFDLRLDSKAVDKSLLKDMESVSESMNELSQYVKKLSRLYTAHDAHDLLDIHEAKSDALRAESNVYVDELLSRAKVLAADYKEIAGTPDMPRLVENLAVFYFETAHMIRNNLGRFSLAISNEREQPGVAFGGPDKDFCEIYLSYAERLKFFLNKFRFLIIGANAVERALLLLECGVEEIQ